MRLAIVTPWFGPDLRGGAEQQSFQLASHLASRGYAVDVLTTSCASFSDDWSRNALRPGVQKSGNLSVYRFKTRHRDRRAFERVNVILTDLARERLPVSVSPIGDEDASVFYNENINAPALLSHLSERGKSYDRIIFIPYLYGTTLNGLPLVAERAYLQPCFHDEPYAYLQRVRENVHAARGLLFNSEGERELGVRLFGPGIIKKSAIVGEGVVTDVAPEQHAEHVGAFAPREHAYVLYLGRQDESKNLGTLLQAWIGFKRRRPTSRLQLVLAGQHGSSHTDRLRGIVDLGSVSSPEKNALLANCATLAQPSLNESFSRVLYEAWAHGHPVIVHRDCLATATAVRACKGGLVAGAVPEWETALQWLDDASPAQLAELGDRGRSFARDYASWDTVIARYERVLGLESPTKLREESPRVPVRQIVPANETARQYAKALGAALERDDLAAGMARRFDAVGSDLHGFVSGANGIAPGSHRSDLYDAAAILHYVCDETEGDARASDEPAPGDQSAPRGAVAGETSARGANGDAAQASGVRAVIFHATDPAPRDRALCVARLARLGGMSPTALASTPQALDELREAGVSNARFAPIPVDPRAWDIVPDRALAQALHDGKQNLLYVGPLVAQGHLDRLMIAFLHYLTLEREARLTIVGTGDVDDGLYRRLLEEVRRLDLVDHVLVTHNLSAEQFVAVFRAADLLISLDGAEHLGEAYLQAMWFDVPILAYRTRIAEALVRDAGLLLADTSDLLAIAALAQLLVVDPALRESVLRAQRRVRASFEGEALFRELTAWHDVPA